MYIERKITLKNSIYFIRVELEYKNINNITHLCINNYKDDYFDNGDFSNLINLVEKSYTEEKAKKYDENISYMADILYIYDRIPFLSGVKDVCISELDNTPYSIGYISKEDIEKYIKDNNIKMDKNTRFKLSNGLTWKV